MQFDSIKYVERKHNIIWTGVGLLTIAANAYLISTASIILPFVLTPAAIAKGNLKTSKGLLTNKYRKFWINPSGYLRKKEKQREKIVNYTEKKTYRFLKNLGKQDRRNNR
ncbi:MAG: hypothetical protein CMC96_14330 [Flavobacteriales bacterium]|nr:hypothetical protein [Flavobacteriales bacterium]|tara:strand:+ start:39282 stop:39611 length:330 start_codon:yes stop_codon:yes gene_type:complete